MSLPVYSWFSQAECIPARWDLRLLGWGLTTCDTAGCGAPGQPILLDFREDSRPPDWRELADRRPVLAIGVDDAEDRAFLLEKGFGDAVDTRVALVELGARLLKLEGLSKAMPRHLRVGPAMLDLFYRDARIDGAWLGLHPREFALLWRLAESPGKQVTRRELLADVWRMDFVPETNSLEVHISRLRAKLAIARCEWLVETDPRGGYRLGCCPPGHRSGGNFYRLVPGQLDLPRRMGDEEGRTSVGDRIDHAISRPRID